MKFRKFLWSIIKWLFKLIGKLLLLVAWGACELLAVIFTALSRWLKGVITSKR